MLKLKKAVKIPQSEFPFRHSSSTNYVKRTLLNIFLSDANFSLNLDLYQALIFFL